MIISNESSDILKFLAVHFKTPPTAKPCPDYYPEAKHAEIDRISRWIISDLGSQVYMCAFAKSQASPATRHGNSVNLELIYLLCPKCRKISSTAQKTWKGQRISPHCGCPVSSICAAAAAGFCQAAFSPAASVPSVQQFICSRIKSIPDRVSRGQVSVLRPSLSNGRIKWRGKPAPCRRDSKH